MVVLPTPDARNPKPAASLRAPEAPKGLHAGSLNAPPASAWPRRTRKKEVDMLIRRATEADMPGLESLLDQVLMVHYHGRPDLFIPGTRKYTDDELRGIIADDERPIFVAVADDAAPGEVLGHAFCVHEHYGSNNMHHIHTLYVDDICVDDHARGMHVGTALYQHVLAYARECGCYNVQLNVWSCNPGAQAFYEAMGMKPYKVGMETIL